MAKTKTIPRRPWYVPSLTTQILIGLVVGGLRGYMSPKWGNNVYFLRDIFLNLIKSIIAPLIFSTLVVGIAGGGDLKQVGRMGAKALLYFEMVSTLALVIGLVIVNAVRPGSGMNVDPATLDAKAVAAYTGTGQLQSTTDFLLNVIPTSAVDAFAKGRQL